MTLKSLLLGRPAIYEVVPPRKDSSRFQTELQGIEDVLNDHRIAAINVPELINRRETGGRLHYSPGTIPPEEYAVMVRDYKEAMVNMVAPRLPREEFLRRARKILSEYKIPNLVLVGKERRGDSLPGPNVVEALGLLRGEKDGASTLGGVCIFGRDASSTPEYGPGNARLDEAKRVWTKAGAGCEFVTSQVTFDSKATVAFLKSYQGLCERTGRVPITVFVSVATVPSPGILSLLERLGVGIPKALMTKLKGVSDMGRASVEFASDVFHEVVRMVEREGITVPLGLQVEQIGVNNDELSLELLDRVYPALRGK